jgi:hypothetical protein
MMGTSFTDYKEFGFWSRDSFLASWLGTLLDEMQSLRTRETWQESLMEHWRVQARIDGGVMSLGLNEFLINDKRREWILSLSNSALQRSDGKARRTGELFIALLSGKLRTTASSPIDYLDDQSPRSGAS